MHNVHKESFLDLSHCLSYTQFPQQSFKEEGSLLALEFAVHQANPQKYNNELVGLLIGRNCLVILLHSSAEVAVANHTKRNGLGSYAFVISASDLGFVDFCVTVKFKF